MAGLQGRLQASLNIFFNEDSREKERSVDTASFSGRSSLASGWVSDRQFAWRYVSQCHIQARNIGMEKEIKEL